MHLNVHNIVRPFSAMRMYKQNVIFWDSCQGKFEEFTGLSVSQCNSNTNFLMFSQLLIAGSEHNHVNYSQKKMIERISWHWSSGRWLMNRHFFTSYVCTMCLHDLKALAASSVLSLLLPIYEGKTQNNPDRKKRACTLPKARCKSQVAGFWR